jgi:hypothetical protein
MYLRWVVIVILAILMIVSLVAGAILVVVGIIGTFQEMNAMLLICIPVGLFLGLMGFVSLDCFNALIDRWGMSK